MIHYILLLAYTLIIIFLTLKLWKRTKEIAFMIGVALMYYWSLLGAWFFIYDDLSGQKGKSFGLHYYDFFTLVFPVHVDNSYLISVAIYALFIIGVIMMLLWMAKPASEIITENEKPVYVNHLVLIGLCMSAALISFCIVWKEVLTAAKFHESVYIVTRMQPGRFFTFHQLLNQVAVVALYIGLIAYISGKKSRYITGSNKKWILAAYAFAIIFVEGYLLFLGNKREILFGGILGIIFYLNNIRFKINYKAFALFLIIIMIPLFFNDGLRAYSPEFLTKYFDTSGLEFHRLKEFEYSHFSMKNTAFTFLYSNEMFYGHFSMYGIIYKHLPFSYGTSIISLFESIIPRFLFPDRQAPIYEYYVEHVNAVSGQGYTIHHAAGWYLNFGIIGILLGSFIFGWIWVKIYNVNQKVFTLKNNFLKLFFILGLAAFTAEIPTMMRSGPESYKALFFEALLLPAIIIYFASKIGVKKSKEIS
ncbi:hypothetical protein BH09BAC5_BH09BAC5_07160 [soil metagenome]